MYDRYVVCCTIDAAAWCMIIDGGVCGALPHFTSCFPLLTSLGTASGSPFTMTVHTRKGIKWDHVGNPHQARPWSLQSSRSARPQRRAPTGKVADQPSAAEYGTWRRGRGTDKGLGSCGKWPAGWYRAYSMKPSRQPSSPPSSQAGMRERALQDEKVSQPTLAQPH